ncbi:four helix bundle protein [Candidatus Sumerlaeota bacterium]|nr:four helix bundle protein [Candidatus Sumerlaeota bacterium]
MMNDEVPRSRAAEKYDLRERTKAFAIRVVRLYCSLPNTTEAQVLGKQVLRSGAAVGAQHREAFRARSSAEFVSKIEAALQELEETAYWFELLIEVGIVRQARLASLHQEANELAAILVSSVKTVKKRQ